MTRKFECSELHLPLLFVSVFFHLYRAKQTLRYGIRAVSAFAPPSSSLTRHACPVSEVEILKRNLDTPQNPKLLYQVSNYGRVTLVHEVEYDCWIWKQERISVLKKMDKKKEQVLHPLFFDMFVIFGWKASSQGMMWPLLYCWWVDPQQVTIIIIKLSHILSHINYRNRETMKHFKIEHRMIVLWILILC